MGVQEEVERVIVELPEIKPLNFYISELRKYLDTTTPLEEMFAKPFPEELINEFFTAKQDNSQRRNELLVKQVWEIVVDLPVAPVPESSKRRRVM